MNLAIMAVDLNYIPSSQLPKIDFGFFLNCIQSQKGLSSVSTLMLFKADLPVINAVDIHLSCRKIWQARPGGGHDLVVGMT